jgi:predicted O-linked N-acetylglucosamine transferase (SPINDLY family)
MNREAALQAKPSDEEKEKFLNRAGQHIKESDWKALEDLCVTFTTAAGHCGEVDFLRALAAFAEEDFVDALILAEAAFKWDSNILEYAEFLAILYILVGDIAKSVYYAKMASAVPSSRPIHDLLPDTLPKYSEKFLAVEEDPLLKRAFAAAAQGKWGDAEHWFRQQMAYDMTVLDAYRGLANCLFIRGRFRDSTEVLRAARHIAPDNAEFASLLGLALTEIGEYAEGQALHRAAMDIDPDDAEVAANALINLWHNPEGNVDAITAAFAGWGERFGLKQGRHIAPRVAEDRDTLIIGYLIGPLGRRRSGSFIADVISNHRRQRFLCVGFGYGALTSPQNIPFQKSFDTWHDIKGMDPITFASMVAAERIDIMVDLCGFTTPDLLVAFGQRLAPVQISAFGAPSGTGLAEMDALLTDEFVSKGVAKSAYRENLVNLKEGSFFVALPEEDDPPSVERESEDESGLNFASDASLGEINPLTVGTWAKILHAVPDSTLLLMDHDSRDEENSKRLVNLFGDFGLAHRVDIVTADTSFALFQDADIGLMPLQFMRPDLICEALWAGVPVISYAGSGIHGRLDSGILHHLGLGDEMVAETPGDYVSKALNWAGDSDRRRHFAAEIRGRMKDSSFLSPAKRAADLEKVYEALWKKACK